MRIGLRKRRQETGLSQQQVADLVGISRSYYTNIELGTKTPSLTTAQRIAAVLETDTDQLFAAETFAVEEAVHIA